jgi:transposase
VDYPPWPTVYGYFRRWSADGTLDQLHDALRLQLRTRAGRQPLPSAAILDAQAVKAADTVGTASRGYDAAKRINGRKRHLAVDTDGLVLALMVTAASVQDRDGGLALLRLLTQRLGSLRLLWADAGYGNRLMEATAAVLGLLLQIVRKEAGQSGFSVLPRRWVVERTFAWLMKSRRLCRDYERRTDHAEAMVKWAMVGLMARRLAPEPRPRTRSSRLPRAA